MKKHFGAIAVFIVAIVAGAALAYALRYDTGSALDLPDVAAETGEASSASASAPKEFKNPVPVGTSQIATADGAVWLTFRPAPDPKWWHGAVIYQIWVRSFYDADNDGHGDLAGIKAKIPYLKKLGVNAVWLSPVFASPSYHGYDITDFNSIDPAYGTLADFDSLVSDLHSNNIKIILDLPVNHVSTRHPWFVASAAGDKKYRDYFIWRQQLPDGYDKPWLERAADSRMVWHRHEASSQWFYGVFDASQPDLNFTNPDVVREVNDAAAFWLKRGVDGFRLDAIRYIIEEGPLPLQSDNKSTYAYWRQFAKHVRTIKPDALLLGESFASRYQSVQYFDEGRGMDMLYDFDYPEGLISLISQMSVKPDTDLELPEHYKRLRDDLWHNWSQRYDMPVPGENFVSFLSSHDGDRLSQRVSGDRRLMTMAAQQLMTHPGTILIYYGQETGQQNFDTSDAVASRAPMHWTSDVNAGFNQGAKAWLEQPQWFPWLDKPLPSWSAWQQSLPTDNRAAPSADFKDSTAPKAEGKGIAGDTKDAVGTAGLDAVYSGNAAANSSKGVANPQPLQDLYKDLIALRTKAPALVHPDRGVYYLNTGTAWVMRYEKGDETVWLLHNLHSTRPAKVEIKDFSGQFDDLYGGKPVNVSSTLELSAGQLMVLRPRPDESQPASSPTQTPPQTPPSSPPTTPPTTPPETP